MRNSKRHEEDVVYTCSVMQIQDIVKNIVKGLYLLITLWVWNLQVIVAKHRGIDISYNLSRLHAKFPARQNLKCNINGMSRGNQGFSSYKICLRIDRGYLIYVKVKDKGIASVTSGFTP